MVCNAFMNLRISTLYGKVFYEMDLKLSTDLKSKSTDVINGSSHQHIDKALPLKEAQIKIDFDEKKENGKVMIDIIPTEIKEKLVEKDKLVEFSFTTEEVKIHKIVK